jgi:hypothetical protein
MSTPANFIFNLASAIATQEGYFVKGSRPDRNNNPGDLRRAPWLPHAVIVDNFWVPSSREAGIAGLYHQICLAIARGETLRQLINIWAPPSDNNPTDTYLANVARWVGIKNVDTPLWDYLDIVRMRG